MIVIVFGLPGSGKSYFAQRLAELLNADYLSSDQLRKQILPQRDYSEQEKTTVYKRLLARLKLLVEEKERQVVVDASFYKQHLRDQFLRELSPKAMVAFIEIIAEEGLIQTRLKTPRADSDADFEVYKKVKQQWEPMEPGHLVLQSTNDNLAELLQKALTYIETENDKRTSSSTNPAANGRDGAHQPNHH